MLNDIIIPHFFISIFKVLGLKRPETSGCLIMHDRPNAVIASAQFLNHVGLNLWACTLLRWRKVRI